MKVISERGAKMVPEKLELLFPERDSALLLVVGKMINQLVSGPVMVITGGPGTGGGWTGPAGRRVPVRRRPVRRWTRPADPAA